MIPNQHEVDAQQVVGLLGQTVAQQAIDLAVARAAISALEAEIERLKSATAVE